MPASTIARCAASASSSGGLLVGQYSIPSLPCSAKRSWSTKTASPFSACTIVSPPCSPAVSIVRQQRLVVGLDDALVGHEHLEARDSLLLDHARDLEPHRFGEIHDHRVEAVVDDRLPLGLGVPAVDRLGEGSGPSPGGRSRRSSSSRRRPHRSCRPASRRPSRTCRPTACRGACGRRSRPGGRTCPRRRSARRPRLEERVRSGRSGRRRRERPPRRCWRP